MLKEHMDDSVSVPVGLHHSSLKSVVTQALRLHVDHSGSSVCVCVGGGTTTLGSHAAYCHRSDRTRGSRFKALEAGEFLGPLSTPGLITVSGTLHTSHASNIFESLKKVRPMGFKICIGQFSRIMMKYDTPN